MYNNIINKYLVVTSIADHDNKVLINLANESYKKGIKFILIGDEKSPNNFNLKNCSYYSIERQSELNFKLAKVLPSNHYTRKNLGYLISISEGANYIVETDDDNIPLKKFWTERNNIEKAHFISNKNWVNVYRYFTNLNIWPRGFALNQLDNELPELEKEIFIKAPIQQGLADHNPDVDAIFRLTHNLSQNFKFNNASNIGLGENTYCPFNSQNTTWFKEAFPLLYLPSYCSFRMTDIWRSFIAQRIVWSCGWSILFHSSSVKQIRNEHNLMHDFTDEISGYINNEEIMEILSKTELKKGIKNIPFNLKLCYQKLIEFKIINKKEMQLLDAWLADISTYV